MAYKFQLGGAVLSGSLTQEGQVLAKDSALSGSSLSIGGTAVSSTAAELNLLDGSTAGTVVNSKAVVYGSSGEVNATTLQIGGSSITATAAEINLIDGGASVGTTSIATGDGFIHNDGGTMKVTQLDKIAESFAGNGLQAGGVGMAIQLATGVGAGNSFTVDSDGLSLK